MIVYFQNIFFCVAEKKCKKLSIKGQGKSSALFTSSRSSMLVMLANCKAIYHTAISDIIWHVLLNN